MKGEYELVEGALEGCSIGCSLVVFLSCVLGIGIGYSGWWCRAELSAASYTLVGHMNKVLTILANTLLWEKHAGPWGTASLFLCLVGGAMYRQAPMRGGHVSYQIVDDKAGQFTVVGKDRTDDGLSSDSEIEFTKDEFSSPLE